MTAPSPSWYDVLDVDPGASVAEIRQAWKAAVADLDPTDRRFRILNQAAEVLLDEEARAEYDRALAGEGDEREQAVEVTEAAQGEAAVAPHTPADEAPTADDTDTEPADPAATSEETTPRRVVPVWVLAALGFLAATLIGLCIWQLGKPTDAEINEATRDAVAAAGPAVEAILSYDYRDLEGTQAAAHTYMTEDYRDDEYDPFFEGVVTPGATETKTTVDAETLLAAVVRSGADLVQVLVYVDRPRTNATSSEPEVFRDQVTVTMRLVEGEWLVNEMATTPLSAG